MSFTEHLSDVTVGTTYYQHPDIISSPGSSWSLVTERFDITSAYAEASYNLTTDYVEKVFDILKELEAFQIPAINSLAGWATYRTRCRTGPWWHLTGRKSLLPYSSRLNTSC